ncbi:MAG: hypothetical protein ACO3IV_03740 [Ilumatobacteraceae bacterium]|jgi:hypothetical protein
MIAIASTLSIVFATVSIVSAGILAYLAAVDGGRTRQVDGAAKFRQHLAALSDDSRGHLRQQLRDSGRPGKSV